MQVAIVGTGLLGSSFGLALKQRGLARWVVGVSSPAVAQKALEVGAIDEIQPHATALPGADLVLLAQPIRRMLKTIEVLDPLLKPGALVTDVGSTKVSICAAGESFIRRGRFVGGHPMAGKAQRGPEVASGDLFEGRPWVMTERDDMLEGIVRAIGARPVLLDAEAHDRLVALSSHLPQLVSTALAAALAGEDVKQVAGPGLLDMTRLALSSFELWDDILATNQANVIAALERLIGKLEAMKRQLGGGSLAEEFGAANEMAQRLRED